MRIRILSSILTGDGDLSLSRSTILSRKRIGDGLRSLIRSLVSTTRVPRRPGGGEGEPLSCLSLDNPGSDSLN